MNVDLKDWCARLETLTHGQPNAEARVEVDEVLRSKWERVLMNTENVREHFEFRCPTTLSQWTGFVSVGYFASSAVAAAEPGV
jgi:hypothetical protein